MTEVEVKQSTIEGLGVFARSPIAAWQTIRVINVVREITPDSPLRPELGERVDHCDHQNGKVAFLGFPDRHLNHSCDPNAFVQYQGEVCYFVARRDIAAGEEITCDYNINIVGGTSWPCHCGAERCRGETLDDFFKLPIGIQREYQPLLAAWFVQPYSESLSAIE